MRPTRTHASKPDKPKGVDAPPGAVSPWVRLRSATSHPFIYEKMVGDVDLNAKPGDVVAIYDRNGTYFGRGLYNPKSAIAVRVLTHANHEIDDTFWQGRLGAAVEFREKLRLSEVTDAYRLVHAEGDGLSGLVAERYADRLVLECFSLGMFERRKRLAELLGAAMGTPASLDRPGRANATWQAVFRADESVQRLEGFRIDPPPPVGPVTIREHGVRYRVDVMHGHKTGFFCDQRDNRLKFAGLCREAEVLDLCCYTGGFSLCAKLIGGAKEVTAVDLDESAIELARQNAGLNQTRIGFVHADAFAYTRQLIANGRQFDCVVLDPPKLATSREELEEALDKYYDLNVYALQTVRPGGVFVTCSCSGLVSADAFTSVVHRAARRASLSLQTFDQTGAGPDHPVMMNCPESAYLKVLWSRVLPSRSA